MPEGQGAAVRIEEEPAAPPQMPLGIVIARIVVVSGMAVAAALAIFLLVGGLWEIGLLAVGVTAVFLLLMFAVEKLADQPEL